MDLGKRIDYSNYLTISKDYVDSQQRPVRLLDKPAMPSGERRVSKGFVIADCLYGFACNPCSFSCKQGAITKSSTSVTPVIDYDKCIGCMECVAQCPGLAIFGYRQDRGQLFLPLEFNLPAGAKEVFLVDDNGKKVGEGEIERVIPKPNKTNIAVVKATRLDGPITDARGFILKENYPEPLKLVPCHADGAETYVCHCEDVSLQEILEALKGRKRITAQELKHVTRLGMGPCRGSRCLPRAKQILRAYGIEVTGEFTPRGPMANLVEIGNVSNLSGAFVAGGGMAGTALFRYLAEAGLKPVLVNKDHGSSWRCIAGGRPAFSVPALAEIANGNLQIFRELQKQCDIDFKMTRYVNFVHDEATYKSLDASRAWSDAYMIDRKDFAREISPYIPDLQRLLAGQPRQDHRRGAPHRRRPGRPGDGGHRTRRCGEGREDLSRHGADGRRTLPEVQDRRLRERPRRRRGAVRPDAGPGHRPLPGPPPGVHHQAAAAYRT